MRAVTRERWIDPQSVNCKLMASDGWLPSDAAAIVAPFYDFPFEAVEGTLRLPAPVGSAFLHSRAPQPSSHLKPGIVF